MRESRRPRTLARRVGALGASLSLLLVIAGVAAADTQRLPLGQGTLNSPKASWEAIGVPPGSVLIDLDDARGSLIQTYASSFGSLGPRGLDATGFRPRSLPSRHALLAGATGSQVRKVKIHITGGATKTLRTVPAPGEWEVRNRLFAYGFTVPARYKKVMRAVTKIEGLNGAGATISTLRKVSTGAY